MASSGVSRRTFSLQTRDGYCLQTDRGDKLAWQQYFSPIDCSVKIERGLFHVIPTDPEKSEYFIKGANGGLTEQPRHWNPDAENFQLIGDMEKAEHSIFSQHGEDGILQFLLERIPVDHKFIVEFGGYDGITWSNSRNLIANYDWSALIIEPNQKFYGLLENLYKNKSRITTINSFVTPENINRLFQQAGVPRDFDILSVDIDSADYYVWKAIQGFEPKIVVIEFNSSVPPDQHYIVDEVDAVRLGSTSRGGASIRAFHELGKSKDYVLVYSELIGGNLFFVHESCADAFDVRGLTPEVLYQPPQYGLLVGGPAPNGRGYP